MCVSGWVWVGVRKWMGVGVCGWMWWCVDGCGCVRMDLDTWMGVGVDIVDVGKGVKDISASATASDLSACPRTMWVLGGVLVWVCGLVVGVDVMRISG